MIGVEADQSVLDLSRADLADRLGLVKSGHALDHSGVDLPQAFLVLNKNERVLERNFLGFFETV